MESHKKERYIPIEIYTDGSAIKDINGINFLGGWSFAIIHDGKTLHIASGAMPNETNQRMELYAAIKALEYIKDIRLPSQKIILYSDSAYLVNCYLQEWYVKWLQNGWQNSSKKEVLNKDLWLQLIPYFDNFWYDFRKVSGHSGIYWNEYCDTLAQKRAAELRKEMR